MARFTQMTLDFLDRSSKPTHVLLSIRPQWYRLILSGDKKYEYRRKYLKGPSVVFLYVTSPISAVCALAGFGQPIIGPADEIARIAETVRPGTGDGIKRYFSGVNEGYAIPIHCLGRIDPVSFKELKERFPKFVVPQSYIRLDHKPELLRFLLDRPLIDRPE